MQNTNKIYQLPILFKSPLGQFFIRNFSCYSSPVLTEQNNNTASSKVSDKSETSKQAPDTTHSHDSTPVTSQDLDTAHKFEEEIAKAGFPEGPKGAAKLYEIVENLREERSNKVDKFRREIDEDREADIQRANNRHTSGDITTRQHNEEKAGIDSYYAERIKDHNQSCETELKGFMETVFDYKKDNNMPEIDSSNLDSSTEMPGPWDDE